MRIVHGPHFVRTGRKRQWHPHFGSKSLAPPTLHRQPFLPVQPIHSLVVDPPPKRSVLGLLPSQENVQSPIAESRADRKSTRLNSSHVAISYAVFCLKKKKKNK